MKHVLFLLGILLAFKKGWNLMWLNKAIFYQNCSVFNNSEMNNGPICGSNGITYSNSLYLDCVNYQTLQNLTVLHPGACVLTNDYCKTNLYYQPVCGSDGQTYSNLESLLCINYKYSRTTTVVSDGNCNDLDYCFGDGPSLYGTDPVCANNGYTYQSAAHVKCLQRRNNDLKILHDGGCTVNQVLSIYGTTEEICDIAKIRYEWNPVYALDGNTYSNPFEFLCYVADLKLLISDDECEISRENNCVYPATSQNVNETFNLEDKVCGSDGVTYLNTFDLQCCINENKYLYLKHSGACISDDDPCGLIPDEGLRFPICGNDNLTYVSSEALWCAKQRFPEKKLKYVHDGPC